MRITYYGQSCFALEMKGKTLLFDPFIAGNPLAKHIDITTLKPDYILLSHGHEDHVADAEVIAKQSGATIIAAYEIVGWYEQKGIQGHPMNVGGSWTFEFGTVKMVNAVHSSVLPDGTHGGPAAGFLVTNDTDQFYFAGDTALTWDMKLIPYWSKLDFAFLPIGDNFTMGISDAVLASDFIKCQQIIGMHYDSFGFIEIDHAAAKKAFSEGGAQLVLPTIGESFEMNNP